MKTFMAVYTGSPGAFEQWQKQFPGEAQMKAQQAKGIEAWGGWVTANMKSITDGGGPLGKTKRISKDGIVDVRNNLSGYTIVKAESQEAAAKLFLKHPHFTVFPGDAVEVMEVLPIPKP